MVTLRIAAIAGLLLLAAMLAAMLVPGLVFAPSTEVTAAAVEQHQPAVDFDGMRRAFRA